MPSTCIKQHVLLFIIKGLAVWIRNYQQTSNWSYSSHPLFLIIGWRLTNLQHLWTSTYSPSYTVALCRSAGCPPKTLLCYLSGCLRDLCETVDSRVVIDFIKDIRFYRAMLAQSAVMRLHVVCLSVRLSVTFRYHDHIGWNSSKIISRPNSLRPLLWLTPTWAIWCNRNTPKIRAE